MSFCLAMANSMCLNNWNYFSITPNDNRDSLPLPEDQDPHE